LAHQYMITQFRRWRGAVQQPVSSGVAVISPEGFAAASILRRIVDMGRRRSGDGPAALVNFRIRMWMRPTRTQASLWICSRRVARGRICHMWWISALEVTGAAAARRSFCPFCWIWDGRPIGIQTNGSHLRIRLWFCCRAYDVRQRLLLSWWNGGEWLLRTV
jgi:hypothetical protein